MRKRDDIDRIYERIRKKYNENGKRYNENGKRLERDWAIGLDRLGIGWGEGSWVGWGRLDSLI